MAREYKRVQRELQEKVLIFRKTLIPVLTLHRRLMLRLQPSMLLTGD
jgi:hypothetical protein